MINEKFDREENLDKASSVVGKLFQDIILLLMHGERGHRFELFIERNGSAQNGTKKTY